MNINNLTNKFAIITLIFLFDWQSVEYLGLVLWIHINLSEYDPLKNLSMQLHKIIGSGQAVKAGEVIAASFSIFNLHKTVIIINKFMLKKSTPQAVIKL